MVLACMAGPFLTAAENKPLEKPRAQEVREPDVAPAWKRRLPDIHFDGLPLQEIVQLLRQQFPEVNFIMKVDEEGVLAGLSINLQLRAVTLDGILKGLQLAYEGRLKIRFGDGDPQRTREDERFVVFERAPTEAAGRPGPDRASATPGPLVVTRAYNIGAYLNRSTPEESAKAMAYLEEAIRTACDMTTLAMKGRVHFRPSLNLHERTKLLIVVGRPDELDIVDQLVKELQGIPVSRATLPAPAREAAPGSSATTKQ